MDHEIKFYRLKRGMTQNDLATAVGVTQQSVAKWESGLVNISIDLVPKIEKALGVRKEILFPELAVGLPQKEYRKLVEEKIELLLPYEIVCKFKDQNRSYYAEITGETYERIINSFRNPNGGKLLWFETIDRMIVAVNLERVSSLEVGMDLDELPPDVIRSEPIDDSNDEESDMDGRQEERDVRLFVTGYSEPFIQFSGDITENPYSLLNFLNFALDDLSEIFQSENFIPLSPDSPEDRFVIIRPENYEFIEAPIALLDRYVDSLYKDDDVKMSQRKSKEKKGKASRAGK